MSNIPAGFQTRYFVETESDAEPVIERDGSNLIVPVFIRQEQRDEGNVFRFFRVPVKYTGQDITDYAGTVLKSWSDIRRFFYGDAAAQSEMRDDHTWESHRQAVRSAFPKHEGDTNPAELRWEEIKADFWATIDAACEDVGKTRSYLPAYFDAETMLEFAAANGMSAAKIATYSQKFITLSLDLCHNDRNWSELFG